MFNLFKKTEKPKSKLANISDKGLDLNEAELKKVIGGDGGTTTTGSGTNPDPSDGKGTRKNVTVTILN